MPIHWRAMETQYGIKLHHGEGMVNIGYCEEAELPWA